MTAWTWLCAFLGIGKPLSNLNLNPVVLDVQFSVMKLNILFTCLLIECACGLSISPYRVMGDVETLYRCCHDVTPCVHEIYHDREYCRSSDNRHCAVVLASEQQYELLKRSWTTESLTQEMTTKVENVKRMLAMESSRSLSESVRVIRVINDVRSGTIMTTRVWLLFFVILQRRTQRWLE